MEELRLSVTILLKQLLGHRALAILGDDMLVWMRKVRDAPVKTLLLQEMETHQTQ